MTGLVEGARHAAADVLDLAEQAAVAVGLLGVAALQGAHEPEPAVDREPAAPPAHRGPDGLTGPWRELG